MPVSGQTAFETKSAFPALRFEDPLFLTPVPDGSGRLAVVEQGGKIWLIDNRGDAADKRLALDMEGRILQDNNEEGLLGLAFHPRFKSNRRLFLYYSAARPRRTVVAALRMDEKFSVVVPSSEEVLLEIPQPYGNHNGGMLAFGPDGGLYIGVGDGGSGGDPHNNGQRLDTLLGKILRIDVDAPAKGKRYGIPKDNPFLRYGEARPEIWAWGLRNPWRFSFDRQTGELWAGDVGQNTYEEIDIIVKGGNFGWNAREGRHPYAEEGRKGPFIEPVAEHPRSEAQSITGGYVYRGKTLPTLRGAYIYGDFVTGRIWSLRKGEKPEEIARGELISSFGEDEMGELYWTSFDGKIYRLSPRLGRK